MNRRRACIVYRYDIIRLLSFREGDAFISVRRPPRSQRVPAGEPRRQGAAPFPPLPSASPAPDPANHQRGERGEQRERDPRGGAAAGAVKVPGINRRRRGIESAVARHPRRRPPLRVVEGPGVGVVILVVRSRVVVVRARVGAQRVVRSAVRVGEGIVVPLDRRRTRTPDVNERLAALEHRVQPPLRLAHRALRARLGPPDGRLGVGVTA
mmetsp:Transcript_14423/g.58846  ORF Transcript_14423/g.58846 Transcript_14423/m.58846 type:complete len:210 (-) Transcript_14423:3241-3870(-)